MKRSLCKTKTRPTRQYHQSSHDHRRYHHHYDNSFAFGLVVVLVVLVGELMVVVDPGGAFGVKIQSRRLPSSSSSLSSTTTLQQPRRQQQHQHQQQVQQQQKRQGGVLRNAPRPLPPPKLERHLQANNNEGNSANLDNANDEQQQELPNEEQQPQEQPERLSVDVTFESIFKTILFLLASWIMAVASRTIGLPSLVGEIVTGFVLGPPWWDFVPYAEAMVLIGSFGLIGLLLDSGINLDIAQLRVTGSRAFLMAAFGTCLALGGGLAVGYAERTATLQSAMAIGVAFAPSSFGVASQVLKNGEILNTPMGQVIVASSVVDDILGLVLLSIMEVLVQDAPRPIDYAIPFISSFGFLLVLGYFGIKVMPTLVEKIILPRFPAEQRDFVACGLLFMLLSAYLPLLYYSGASYLTGAFLAGLSFSQIHTVHATYVNSEEHLKTWLMRIFFAATIGFQVPIRYFTNGDVLNFGFLYLVPVLAKIPLGLLVPRLHNDVPENFPFVPYRRDVIVTILAMLCRGEFNFIVAAFALQAGVLDAEHYAAVVFAILASAIFAPLALSKVLKYYNTKFREYLKSNHRIERILGTRDGQRPLFLAIQARTPVAWDLQDKFRNTLESMGLIILDHRNWHTLGLDAVDITEIFCQDTETSIRIKHCFSAIKTASNTSSVFSTDTSSPVRQDQIRHGLSTADTVVYRHSNDPISPEDLERISKRKQEIQKALVDCLGNNVEGVEYVIQVTQWEAYVDDDSNHPGRSGKAYRLLPQQQSNAVGDGVAVEDVLNHGPNEVPLGTEGDEDEDDEIASQAQSTNLNSPAEEDDSPDDTMLHQASSNMSAHLDSDLWDVDDTTHDLARSGFFMSPVDALGTQEVTEGFLSAEQAALRQSLLHASPQHRRNNTIESITHDIEASIIKERLQGLIRS